MKAEYNNNNNDNNSNSNNNNNNDNNKHFIEPQQSYIQYLKKEEKTIHLQILKSRNNLPYIKEKEIDIVKSRKFRIL